MSRSAAVKQKSENTVVRYLRDTRAELSKVTWPTREEGTRLTVIVTIVTIIAGISLYGIDLLFGSLIGLLLNAV